MLPIKTFKCYVVYSIAICNILHNRGSERYRVLTQLHLQRYHSVQLKYMRS